MSTIKKGDTIKVHYTGKLNSGEVFDSSEGREPLEFKVGAGMMIPGFDKGVEGMAIGEKKTITIAPEDGYGQRNDEHVLPFPKANVPEGMELEIGQMLTLSDEQGHPFQVVVREITEETVMLDANHFLAGEHLTFDVEVVSNEPASLIIKP